jgi:hypothetical protein
MEILPEQYIWAACYAGALSGGFKPENASYSADTAVALYKKRWPNGNNKIRIQANDLVQGESSPKQGELPVMGDAEARRYPRFYEGQLNTVSDAQRIAESSLETSD